MQVDNIYDLFRQRLQDIIHTDIRKRTMSCGLLRLKADAVDEDEDLIDAVARHMCSALSERDGEMTTPMNEKFKE